MDASKVTSQRESRQSQLWDLPSLSAGNVASFSGSSTPSRSLSRMSDVKDIKEMPSVDDFKPRASRQEIKLTDQTNLLPLAQIIPIFLAISMCILVSTLDSVIVATALPTISSFFHAGAVSSVVPAAYMLTSTTFQPLYGRFSDIFGRKLVLCGAITIYIIGCIGAGFSRSVIELIIFRGFAGAGGGGLISIGQIIISDIVSLRDRGKYQGIISGFLATGYAIGPVLGGVLAEKVSWRWAFWITVPLAFLSIIIIMFVLPAKPVEGDIKRKLFYVDYLGTILSLVGCALIILPLIWGGVTFPWSSSVIIETMAFGVFLIVIFCVWEWKAAELPIIPMYIFKNITVVGVYISMFINGFIFFSSMYYLPQFSQVALGFSPMRSGLFLIPLLVSQAFTSVAAGAVMTRFGKYRVLIWIGFSVWAVSCGLISTITVSSRREVFIVYMILAGIGAGQTQQTTTVAAQASVPRKDMAVVTAVRNFIRLLGGTLSLAIGSTLTNNFVRKSMVSLNVSSETILQVINQPSALSDPASFNLTASDAEYIIRSGYTRGFQYLFSIHAALSVVAVFVGMTMIRQQSLTRSDDSQLKEVARKSVVEKKSKDKMPKHSPTPSQDDFSSTGDLEAGTSSQDDDPVKIDLGVGASSQHEDPVKMDLEAGTLRPSQNREIPQEKEEAEGEDEEDEHDLVLDSVPVLRMDNDIDEEARTRKSTSRP